MPVHESPLARLERHARGRSLDVAVVEQRVVDGRTEWPSLTWNELYRRVIDGAAGMIEAGVNPGQVVVIRVPTGIRQLELELATRVAGAVPLLLPDHLDPAEVGRLLDEIQVRLVIVDHESRLPLLRRAALGEAQLFECDDRSWERLRGMGLERRKRQPDLLSYVDSVRADAPSGAVLGLRREKAQAWLFRPECSGTLSDLRADDVVLLAGEATDRFTAVVRDAHLTAGCTLAWVETPDQLEAALAHVRPTHVLLDHTTAKVLEDLLEAGLVDGAPWHETPARCWRPRRPASPRPGSPRAPGSSPPTSRRWSPGGADGCDCWPSTRGSTGRSAAWRPRWGSGSGASRTTRPSGSSSPASTRWSRCPSAPTVAVSTVTLPRRGGVGADLDSAFSLAGS